MELTQVEGLSDLINADTEEQRKQALAQMSGVQRAMYDGWRAQLLKALAYTEALISKPNPNPNPSVIPKALISS
jgi:tRNA modification GTPase